MTEKLPSIDDFYEELPSVDELIKEEKLPSVDEFIEPPRPEEEIADAIRQSEKEEPVDTAPCSIEEQYTEFVRLVNDVREDIPKIPEIKYYDEQIAELSTKMEEMRESIPEIPEQKSYDVEIEAICGLIDKVDEKVDRNSAEIPEIKYYDEDIEKVNDRFSLLEDALDGYRKAQEINKKVYHDEIEKVRSEIPKFPKWVNEVNEVPTFDWIGKSFGVVDSRFVEVHDSIDSIDVKLDDEVKHIYEDIDVKRFESKTEIEEITKNFTETKEKIYEELRTAAVGILDIKHAFKNDDRLMKKQIMSKYNLLKLNVEEQIEKFNKTNEDTKDLYAGYFESLSNEISNLPKVKYYEEDIKNIREEFSKGLDSLKILVEDIRQKQKILKEEVAARPIQPDPSEDNVDPLTPTDQNFATHEDLAKHYKLFINRVQQQLYTIGGGGAGFIKDLDDVDFDQTTGLGQLLIYDGSQWVGIASTALDKSSTLHEALTQGNVSGIGMSVGVITATNGFFSGIVTASQLNYDVVTDIFSTGIVTATKGIQQTGTEGLHVTAGVSTFVGLSSFLNGVNVKAGSATTALIIQGDARITGILTIGTGSVTIDGSEEKVRIGTGVTLTSSGDSDFVGVVTAKGFEVGTAATISNNGNATFAGIVTAVNFVGGGSGLTGLTASQIPTLNQDTTGNADTATALETARNIGGVSFDGSANINLPGVNEAGNQNTSGTAAGLTGNPTITITAVNVGTAATIAANGNATFSGIVTASNFVGDGSGLTGVANTDHVSSTTLSVSGVTTSTGGLKVGTAATIASNGNATFSGIVTATSFVGSGANLTGLPAGVTINTNADNRIITGSGTANTLNGESSLTFDGTKLSVSTGATVFTNGNIAAGIVTATSFVGDGSGLTGVGASEEDTAVSSTSATTVLSFAKATYRAAFIKVVVTQGSAYQSGKYSLIHDGTTVTVVEENAIATGSMLGSFSGTISGDNVLFQVTMGSSSSATVTILKDLVTV